MLVNKKALWVSDELHAEVKGEAAFNKMAVGEFVNFLLVCYREKLNEEEL